MALSSGIVATAASVRIVMCDVMLRFNDINKIIVRQQLRTEYRTSPDDGLQKLLLVMMLEFQGKSVRWDWGQGGGYVQELSGCCLGS